MWITGTEREGETSMRESRVKILSRGEGPAREEEEMEERMPSKPFFMLEIRFLAWVREAG